MSKRLKKLSWKAVRRGSVFCSSACGHNCTWAGYQNALRLSQDLCRRLGPKWVPDVKENLGWHAAARYRPGHLYVTVRKDTDGKLRYVAYLNFERRGAGGHFVASGDDPAAGVQNVIDQLRCSLARRQALLATVSGGTQAPLKKGTKACRQSK